MIFSLNPARGSRILNGLALLGVTGVLGVAFSGSSPMASCRVRCACCSAWPWSWLAWVFC